MVVRKVVWDNRRKLLPPVPKKYPTFTTPSTACTMLLIVDKFVLQNDRANLGSESYLKQLAAADVILMDSTFYYCSKFFAQVFTIHCAANGHYIPLLFGCW
jgi:hypothetical protein